MAVINGGGGPDTLTGDTNAADTSDQLNGFGGNDVLRGGWESDDLNGGPNTDRADYDFDTPFGGPATQGITALLYNGTVVDQYGFTDTITGVENVTGTNEFGDLMYGDAQANNLQGLGGNDTLWGGGPNGNQGDGVRDVLNGGAGNDFFYLANQDGNDEILGGSGIDTVDFWSGDVNISTLENVAGAGLGFNAATAQVEVIEMNGNDVIGSDSAEAVDLTNVTVVDAGQFSLAGGNDTFNGSLGADNVLGGLGNDSLSGAAGADILDGEGGADTLSGAAGQDSLSGGAGNDSLDGGADADDLLGQAGNDNILGGGGGDFIEGGRGVDTMDGQGGEDTFWQNRGDSSQSNAVAPDRIDNFTGASSPIGDFIVFDDNRVNPPAGNQTLVLDTVDAVGQFDLYRIDWGFGVDEFILIDSQGDVELEEGEDYIFV